MLYIFLKLKFILEIETQWKKDVENEGAFVLLKFCLCLCFWRVFWIECWNEGVELKWTGGGGGGQKWKWKKTNDDCRPNEPLFFFWVW